MRKTTATWCAATLALAVASVPTVQAASSRQAATPGRSAATIVEKQPERPAISFDLQGALLTRHHLHSQLMAERVDEGLAAPMRIAVTPAELDAIDKSAFDQRPVRVGLVKPVGETISLGDLAPARAKSRSLARGAAQRTRDGGYVYTTAVTSPGATALRVHFADFWMPEGAELFLYNESGEVFGPYTASGPHGDGNFWTHTIMGDRAILQVRQHGTPSREALQDTWFVVAELGHVGPRLFGPHQREGEKSFCQYNASCVESAGCGTSPAVSDAEQAVAHMQWISGPYIYICSGGLIADSDPSTEIPYFLSANHCISRRKDARNLETFFQLATSSCGSTTCDTVLDTRGNHPSSLRTLGASIRSTSSTGDYTLFELDQPAPAGSVFLGWTTADVANANGMELYRISHPGGAPQAYSEHTVDTGRGTCGSWPRGSWIYSGDTYGATEGGSSGSPVVNGSGQVVGQLSGGCGTNVNDVCDAGSNATVDGAFASYYNRVSQYLGTVCTPSAEACSDGADNDCDGAVDCADSDCSGDPACSGGGCTLGGNGDSCNSGADCCSGKCRRGSCKGN